MYTFYSINKQYVEGEQKRKKILFDECLQNRKVALPFLSRSQAMIQLFKQKQNEGHSWFLGSYVTPYEPLTDM